MTNKLPIINNFPMTMLAQMDDVAVFQTAAFAPNNTDEPAAASQQRGFNSQTNHQANYGALNLGLHVNDDAAKVLDNRMSLLAAINAQMANESSQTEQHIAIHSLHWVSQVHGKQIHDIDTTPLSMAPMAADAIISKQSGRGLAIMTADCVPIVLYQPASGKIAAIHAGWQGLACGVIRETVERFTDSGSVQAWIGVCISQANYEVGHQVRDQLLAGCLDNQLLTASDSDSFDSLYVMRSDSGLENHSDTQHLHKTVDKRSNCATVHTDKVKLNLPKLAADQLTAAGVSIDNKEPISCSYADRHYYSYRRQTHMQQPATGRMALVIVRRAAT